jgi:Cell division protein 48 (CDC48), N-terminal domain
MLLKPLPRSPRPKKGITQTGNSWHLHTRGLNYSASCSGSKHLEGKISRDINAFPLKVLGAYPTDVSRGVARVDYDSMDTLTAATGDVIEIKGKRRTVAKCLPL